MIDPVFKAKWIAALRSGAFKQTEGFLRRGQVKHAYCCLGVACVIADFPLDEVPLMRTSWRLGDQDLGEVIPGLQEIQADELASLNDAGKPFSEIATWIEENL